MLVDKSKILEYIPQRDPFVMIDNLIECNSKEFMTNFKILENNLFILNNSISESALIENIAQTCAVGFGFLDDSTEPKIGYIGALTKLKIFSLPIVGDELITKTKIINDFQEIYLLKGEVSIENKILMECQLKIVTTSSI
jgi:3-hydroxymyristoyl/3-hydroxydecanoyl-(acyl carrier protein) dehydratase